MSTEPTVFVIDDDDAVRLAIEMLLKSVGLQAKSYASAVDFLDAYDPKQSGCLVLDLRMPGMSGLALQETLATRQIEIPIIFITGHGDVPTAVRAVKANAFDFVEKPFNDQYLLDRIHAAIDLDAKAREKRAKTADISARIASLTVREQEVLRLLVDAMPNKAIASELNISPKTVETHRKRIIAKMGAKSLIDLVKMVSKV